MFLRGIPLSVFLSKAVGSAEGFCLSEPVPRLLSFDGLITEAEEGVELLVTVSPELLPPAVLEMVEVDVAAVVEDVGEELGAKMEGDLIEDDRPLEPLGVKLFAVFELTAVGDFTPEGDKGSEVAPTDAVPFVIAFASAELEDAVVLEEPLTLLFTTELLLPLELVPEEEAVSPLFLNE